MKNNGQRYCTLCNNKLKKNGKNQSGHQNWYCSNCKKSFVLKRKDLKEKYKNDRLTKCLIGHKSQLELEGNSRTFREQSKTHWYTPLEIPETGEVHDVIILDGIWIRDKTKKEELRICLIGRTIKYELIGKNRKLFLPISSNDIDNRLSTLISLNNLKIE